MSVSSSRALAFAAAAVLGLAAAVTPAHATTTASASFRDGVYFGCLPGYVFEVEGSAARCRRPERTITTALVPCPNIGGVGLFIRTDFTGNKDMCTGTNPVTGEVAVERACPAGYTKRIVSGNDRCEQRVPEEVQPPTAVRQS